MVNKEKYTTRYKLSPLFNFKLHTTKKLFAKVDVIQLKSANKKQINIPKQEQYKRRNGKGKEKNTHKKQACHLSKNILAVLHFKRAGVAS